MEIFSDKELLQQLTGGSHEAFSLLYKKYWKKIFLFAFQRLNDTKQSQDIVQDIFVSLWERKEELEIENLNAWLYASVRYSVFKLVEAGKASEHFFSALKELDTASAAADSSVISAELLSAYRDFLDKMPAARRRIFQLRHDEGMKTRDIAILLNISQKTVQNQLLRTYQEIRVLLARVLFFSILAFIIK